MVNLELFQKLNAVSLGSSVALYFVLFEHAAGYGLFRLQEFEEIAEGGC